MTSRDFYLGIGRGFVKPLDKQTPRIVCFLLALQYLVSNFGFGKASETLAVSRKGHSASAFPECHPRVQGLKPDRKPLFNPKYGSNYS